MDLTPGEIIKRTDFLSEILLSNEKIIFSRYNVSGTLIDTNASNMIYDTLLRYSKRLTDAVVFGENSNKPVIITVDFGLMWSVAFERDEFDQLQTLHVLGPVLSTSLSEENISLLLRRPSIRAKWKPKLIEYIQDVPVVPATNFFKYTLMLHYAVTNINLKPSDITFLDFNESEDLKPMKAMDYAKYFSLEDQMAEFVRTGDIHYKGKIHSASSIMSEIQPLAEFNPALATQLSTSFCVLCIRAAVDGGISPDTAYIKGTAYLNSIAVANSFAQVISICHNAFEDFVFSVHNHQELPSYSHEIVSCIDYIQTHTEDDLSIEVLADRVGYTGYYLSKKFKSEVGMSINSYIKQARIERAQYLLVTTKLSIQDISDNLHFGNRNFFTKVFKEVTGTNPAEFKKAHSWD